MKESWGEKGYAQKTDHVLPRGLIQYKIAKLTMYKT
jgi:hypothetical protein